MTDGIYCPKCKSKLIDKGGKRKWRTIHGKSRSSLSKRTKFTRIWQCVKCKHWFAVKTMKQILTEVELAENVV